MEIDRRWMYERVSSDGSVSSNFVNNVDVFIVFAMNHPEEMDGTMIRCACINCKNNAFLEPELVRWHIVRYGFVKNYYRWICHGEPFITERRDWIEGSSSRAYECGGSSSRANERGGNSYRPMEVEREFVPMETQYEDVDEQVPNPDALKFYNLLREHDTPLYPGCKLSLLAVITRLMGIKSQYNFSCQCYNGICELMHEVMPDGNQMPRTFYETKKLVESLGLPAVKIDCCREGCMLYWKEDAGLDSCKFCDTPRGGKNSIMWYFPLTPRLQRLYASHATANYMRWHAEHEQEEDIMTHVSDAEAWKHFDRTHPAFSSESRNVRLALSTDGFSPFGKFGKQYSSWPVVLNPYNLPPWLCMSQEFMFLTVLIPGPRNPKQLIDVFLQPLIDELNHLWSEGAQTYDISRGQNFKMRAALMGTIGDFPAYGMLSGWSTQGKLACPVCMGETDAFTLPHGGKQSWFDCHRKFLPLDHEFRTDKVNFIKGKEVLYEASGRMTGTEILDWITRLKLKKVTEMGWEKHNKRVQKGNPLSAWKKRSIFWDLPYWKTLLVRHNLDVMHIEKNFFDNLFNTVLDIHGKTKDNEKSRLDLPQFCNRPEMAINENGKFEPASYCLTGPQVKVFCEWIKKVKFSDGYASNISRCISGSVIKSGGMKSHDCHVFLQRLLPIALREFLPEPYWAAITELCLFFKDLTCTTPRVSNLVRLEKESPIILCQLETIFPPSFFDSMEHVMVHLAYEARVGGPVQGRWMYPYERGLGFTKRGPGNHRDVEASIGNNYLAKEISNFGQHYFKPIGYNFGTKRKRNDDGGARDVIEGTLPIFSHPGRVSGKCRVRRLSDIEYHAAATYVLLNCPEVNKFVGIFSETQRRKSWRRRVHLSEQEISEKIDTEFRTWFKDYVEAKPSRVRHDEFLYSLALGPMRETVKTYPAYYVNGYRFETLQRGKNKACSNSGVCIKGLYDFSDPSTPNDFYGNLIEVIELEYPRAPLKTVIVFKCDWYDNGDNSGRYHKQYKLVDIDITKRYPRYDPFILASQASQVCYIPYPSCDTNVTNLRAVCKIKARGVFIQREKRVEDVHINNDDAFQDDEPIGQAITGGSFVIDLGNLYRTNHDSDYEIDSDEDQEPPEMPQYSSDSDEILMESDDEDYNEGD